LPPGVRLISAISLSKTPRILRNFDKLNEAIEPYARAIEEHVDPNIFAVGTLQQARVTNHVYRGKKMSIRIPGDRHRYEAEAWKFIKRLSKRIYGKAYDRHKKLLPAAVTLEGGVEKRFHLNLLIRHPDWMDEVDFEQAFLAEWNELHWSRPDVMVYPALPECVRYSLKEGPDSLLLITPQR
jgi:hypothetical protein